jgi:putative transcriptional regulator
MITHHPSDACLLAYAAGTLPEALAIVVATHIGRCAQCRQALAAGEATGGMLLDELLPVSLSGNALDTVLARMDEPPAIVPPVLNPELPAPLDRIALGRWWPIGLGTRWRPLRTEGAAWAGLILAQPGRALPRHGHIGRELTCILSGAFADGDGVYQVGDVAEPDGDHDHPPAVVGAEPCLCVLASEGMRLRGLLGVGQRLIGL